MGNSIQTKKKKKKSALTEEGSPSVTPSPKRQKAASFRLPGRVDRQSPGRRTAGRKEELVLYKTALKKKKKDKSEVILCTVVCCVCWCLCGHVKTCCKLFLVTLFPC